MTPAERNYERAAAQLKMVRARLLADLAGKCDDADLPDVLAFAARLGDHCAADSLTAFRTAQAENLRTAQADLDRLTGADEAQQCLAP